MRAIAFVLFSLALSKAAICDSVWPVPCSGSQPLQPTPDTSDPVWPVPCSGSQPLQPTPDTSDPSPCPCSGSPPPSSPCAQQPSILYSVSDSQLVPANPGSAYPGSDCNIAGLNAISGSVPASAVPSGPSQQPDDINSLQAIADSSASDAPSLQILPRSNEPCCVQKSTEVTHEAAETIVQNLPEIHISREPTRITIHHAPTRIRQGAVVVNRGGNTITKEITRNTLPAQVQVRPVIVNVVKPINRKFIIEKPAPSSSCQTYVGQPQAVDPCVGSPSSCDSCSSSPCACPPSPPVSYPSPAPCPSPAPPVSYPSPAPCSSPAPSAPCSSPAPIPSPLPFPLPFPFPRLPFPRLPFPIPSCPGSCPAPPATTPCSPLYPY